MAISGLRLEDAAQSGSYVQRDEATEHELPRSLSYTIDIFLSPPRFCGLLFGGKMFVEERAERGASCPHIEHSAFLDTNVAWRL